MSGPITRQPCSIFDDNAISSCIADKWRQGIPDPVPRRVALAGLTCKHCHRGEASLEEIVSDPIVQAVMEADGVNPHELDAMLRRVARHLSIAGRTDANIEAE